MLAVASIVAISPVALASGPASAATTDTSRDSTHSFMSYGYTDENNDPPPYSMTCGFHVDVYRDNTAYTSPVDILVSNYGVAGPSEVCWFVTFDIKVTWKTEYGQNGSAEEKVTTGDYESEELLANNTYSDVRVTVTATWDACNVGCSHSVSFAPK
jgi:hypothetical protein